MAVSTEQQIFKKGSKTYYNSSFFFPKNIREDIYRLYSFVRVVDNFVDEEPYRPDLLKDISLAYKNKEGSNLDKSNSKILENILYLEKKYKFDKKWIPAFLTSMEMDAQGYKYKTMKETLKYIYGSAEVIGLMMSTILGVKDKKGLEAAKLQGRAMQYINFIRDIDEDIKLGRCYFPSEERKKYNLTLWDKKIVKNKYFNQFVLDQLRLYGTWQKEAQNGWAKIPFRSRIAVITASNMYNWTASQIAKDPRIVFQKKVKPTKLRVLFEGIKVAITGR